MENNAKGTVIKMKKLFGICMDRKSEAEFSEEKFLVKEYEDDGFLEKVGEIEQKYDRSSTKLNLASTVKQLAVTVLFLALTIISYSIVSPMTEGDDASILPLLIPMAFAVLFFITTKRFKIKNTSYDLSEETLQANGEKDKELKKLYAAVGIPEDAVMLDILDYTYKTDKNGNEKMDGYVTNLPMWAFLQDEKLYLSDEYSLYAFPKDSFKEMRYIEKKFSTYESSWSKSTLPTDMERANGSLIHREYLSVILDTDGEKYELRLPAYEATAMAKLTGLYPRR